MIGISIYLSEERTIQNVQWIEKAASLGLRSIFTSLHIPEDDPNTYLYLLKDLGSLAKKFNMELFADVSPKSLGYLGLDFQSLDELVQWGLTGIRVDYGFTSEEIVELSKKMKVGINASTVSETEIDILINKGLIVKNVEAWHNFYPRPETGLDTNFLMNRNRFLKSKGFTTVAFIPGDKEMRGPVYAGLPTLEKHRTASPVTAAAELFHSYDTDKVLIGDLSVTNDTLNRLSIIGNGMIPLRMKPINDRIEKQLFNQIHTNRMDPARDVIRSVESRSYAQKGTVLIAPSNQLERKRGTITIDNQLYGRYAGELQITIHDLPKDDRVNVIGHVIEEDLPLLSFIKAGGKFQFMVRD
ncbi:DUF871 domain-containing protein [Aeribacillus composti]|jgi:uncharacterized protein|uniref:DUF871 domain-containing protein n=1 Tax=Aeribacillus composti TaxID=1868734 RepID=UPI000E396027|nr:MupG family TIM beta-alpha barrel fold protein [Aeribacillus composti]REJ26087.1 MAG: DUF871 domain-containing protein [Bacillaceae bacterium]BBU37898.1 hypothetical protein APP_01900 [Aeribacillus pallidus]